MIGYPNQLQIFIKDNAQTDKLRQAKVEILPRRDCCIELQEYNKKAKLGALRNGISQGQYCAYDLPRGCESCKSSSGGPLQYKKSTKKSLPHIVGISSFNIECDGSLPTIYTRVAFYLDWIESHVWPTSG